MTGMIEDHPPPAPRPSFLQIVKDGDLQDVGRTIASHHRIEQRTGVHQHQAHYFTLRAAIRRLTYTRKGNKETTPATACLLACLLACTMSRTYVYTPDHRKPETPYYVPEEARVHTLDAVRRSLRLSHQRLSSPIINFVFLSFSRAAVWNRKWE